MVPESKFTHIFNQKSFKMRDGRPDEATGTTASEVVVSPAIVTKPGSAMDRAMRKHRPRVASDTDKEFFSANNLTY